MPSYKIRAANFVAQIDSDEELIHLAEVDTIKKDTKICVLPGKEWVEAKTLGILRKVWGLDVESALSPVWLNLKAAKLSPSGDTAVSPLASHPGASVAAFTPIAANTIQTVIPAPDGDCAKTMAGPPRLGTVVDANPLYFAALMQNAQISADNETLQDIATASTASPLAHSAQISADHEIILDMRAGGAEMHSPQNNGSENDRRTPSDNADNIAPDPAYQETDFPFHDAGSSTTEISTGYPDIKVSGIQDASSANDSTCNIPIEISNDARGTGLTREPDCVPDINENPAKPAQDSGMNAAPQPCFTSKREALFKQLQELSDDDVFLEAAPDDVTVVIDRDEVAPSVPNPDTGTAADAPAEDPVSNVGQDSGDSSGVAADHGFNADPPEPVEEPSEIQESSPDDIEKPVKSREIDEHAPTRARIRIRRLARHGQERPHGILDLTGAILESGSADIIQDGFPETATPHPQTETNKPNAFQNEELRAARAAIDAARQHAGQPGNRLNQDILKQTQALIEALEHAQNSESPDQSDNSADNSTGNAPVQDSETAKAIEAIENQKTIPLRQPAQFLAKSEIGRKNRRMPETDIPNGIPNLPDIVDTNGIPASETDRTLPHKKRDFSKTPDLDEDENSDILKIHNKAEFRRMLQAEARAAETDSALGKTPAEHFSPQDGLRQLFEKQDELHLYLANEIREKESEVENQNCAENDAHGAPKLQSDSLVALTDARPVNHERAVVKISQTAAENTAITKAPSLKNAHINALIENFFRDKLMDDEQPIGNFGPLHLTTHRIWHIAVSRKNIQSYAAYDLENVQGVSLKEKSTGVMPALFLLLAAACALLYFLWRPETALLIASPACLILAILTFFIRHVAIQISIGNETLSAPCPSKARCEALSFLNRVEAAKNERRRTLAQPAAHH